MYGAKTLPQSVVVVKAAVPHYDKWPPVPDPTSYPRVPFSMLGEVQTVRRVVSYNFCLQLEKSVRVVLSFWILNN